VPAEATKDHLKIDAPVAPSPPSSGSDAVSLLQPLHSFILSFLMIIFSEIGDKTFIIAALMAMKHPPLLVFSAAFPALLLMTVLSAILGHAVPALISPRFTDLAAAILFLFFGGRMLREGLAMRSEGGMQEEIREVEMELEEKEQLARRLGRRRSSITPYMLEAARGSSRHSRSGSRLPAPPASPPSSPDSRSPSPGARSSFSSFATGLYNLFSLLLSPAWVQTFVMTFLGEWGDRSQIATIAMAAGQDYWWVSGGALFGHSLCTLAAVMGGRAIAGRVSMKKGTWPEFPFPPLLRFGEIALRYTTVQSPSAEQSLSWPLASSTWRRRRCINRRGLCLFFSPQLHTHNYNAKMGVPHVKSAAYPALVRVGPPLGKGLFGWSGITDRVVYILA
jgi:Ca2+/H+ antiporter, TMEM165/GDT1 family